MIVLFLSSDFLSLLGNSAIMIVLPWLVLERTGDAAVAGSVAALSAIPGFFIAIIGGSLIDRFGRRRMSFLSDFGSAAAVAMLPIVDLAFGLNISWFIVLGILGALFDVPGMTARESLLPDIAKAGRVSLDKLSGVREALFGVSFLCGPAIAGIALTLFDAVTVVWLTAAASASAAILTWLLPNTIGVAADRITSPGSGASLREASREWALSVKEGFVVLKRNGVALATTIMSTGYVLAFYPLSSIILPTYFQRQDTPEQLGLILSAVALGMIFGSVLYGPLTGIMRRRTLFVISMVGQTVVIIAFVLLPPFELLLVGGALFGFMGGLSNPLWNVLVAEHVAESARGRVLGLQNAAALAAAPVGIFIGGLVTEGISVQAGMVFVAVLLAVTTVYAVTNRPFTAIEPGDATIIPDEDGTPN